MLQIIICVIIILIDILISIIAFTINVYVCVLFAVEEIEYQQTKTVQHHRKICIIDIANADISAGSTRPRYRVVSAMPLLLVLSVPLIRRVTQNETDRRKREKEKKNE